MTEAERQVAELFAELRQTFVGPAARAILDEAIAIADEAEDEDLGYRARMRLLMLSPELGDDEAKLTSFAWCVAHHDADPARFPLDGEDGDLLWSHKWIPGTLADNPMFPREDIDAALDQLTEAFRRAGVGESGVVQTRLSEAVTTGRFDEAATWFERLRATPVDDYSDCAACVASNQVGYLVGTGRDEEAIALAEGAVEDGLSCSEQPEHLMAQVLLPLLRAGRGDQALAWHLSSYRHARTDPEKLGTIAEHLTFCAVTGNLERGLELADRHLGWLGHDRLNLAHRLEALLAFGTLLEALVRAGEGEQTVPRVADPRVVAVLGPSPVPTAAALAPRVWEVTRALAATFDERNGNTMWHERWRQAQALAEETYPVQVGTATQATPAAAEPPADAAAYAELATTCAALGMDDDARRAARAGLALDPTAQVRVRLLGALAAASGREEVAPVIAQRVAALREAGDEGLATLEQDLGAVRWTSAPEPGDAERAERALAAVTDPWLRTEAAWTLSRVLPDGSPEQRAVLGEIVGLAEQAGNVQRTADAAHRLGWLALEEGRADDALALAEQSALAGGRAARQAAAGERVGPHLVLSPSRARVAMDHLLRASALAALGRGEDAVADLEAVADIAVAVPARVMAVEAFAFMAQLLEQLGRHDEALVRWQAAVAQGRWAELPELAMLRLDLGRALVDAGRPDEAVDEFVRVLDGAGDDQGVAAEALFHLGRAHEALGERDLAYQVWSEVLDTTSAAGDDGSAARAGAALATMLADLDPGEAATAAERAVAAARRTQDPGVLLGTLQHCAQAWAVEAPERALAGLEEAVQIATELDDPAAVADLIDTRARVLAEQGEVDAAVRTALDAADRFADLDITLGAAGSTLLAGQVLLDAGRHADAAVLLAEAVEASVEHPGMHAHACLLAGDCYEALGRHAEAQRVRARVNG